MLSGKHPQLVEQSVRNLFAIPTLLLLTISASAADPVKPPGRVGKRKTDAGDADQQAEDRRNHDIMRAASIGNPD